MSTVLPSASRFLVSAPRSHALCHRLRHIYGLLEDVLRWHSCLVWFQIIRPISIVNLLFSTVFDEMRYITLKMHSWEETASKHMVNELVWQLVWLIESGHESQDRPYCKAYPGCTTCVFAIEVAEAADHTGDRFPDGGEDIIVYLKWNDNVQATLVAWRALPWMVKFVRPRPFAFQTEGAEKGYPRTSIIALLVTQLYQQYIAARFRIMSTHLYVKIIPHKRRREWRWHCCQCGSGGYRIHVEDCPLCSHARCVECDVRIQTAR